MLFGLEQVKFLELLDGMMAVPFLTPSGNLDNQIILVKFDL